MRAHEDRRKRFLEQRAAEGGTVRLTADAVGLSHRMEEALEFIAEADEAARKRMKRPLTSSLTALKQRGLVAVGEGPLGLVLTKRGRRAIRQMEPRRRKES